MSQKKEKIVFVHLLNNRSGSPNVLATVAEGIYKKGIDTTIISSFNNDGFLSDILATEKINISYSFKNNIFLRLIELLKFQLLSGFKVLSLPKNSIVYINTVLPFIAAFVAKAKGMRVIYHVHEAYAKKTFFQKFCFWSAESTSEKLICVSHYVKNYLSETGKKKSVVIYNALSKNFLENQIAKKETVNKTVLMICSARAYKGIYEFCELAKQLIQYEFVLVVDATLEEIRTIFSQEILNLKNLKIYPSQKNLHTFYSTSSIILNLSKPDGCVETFGLTILEGMYYGLPAIVPPVGGITELVQEGQNGLKIDSRDFEKIKEGLTYILEDDERYQKMSQNALKKSSEFSPEIQINTIFNEIF